MDAAKEFYFLTELRYLTETALWHAERIRQVAGEWVTAQEEVRKPEPKSQVRFSLERPEDFIRALEEERGERGRRRQQLYNQFINAQWETFARVDAFLAACGRIALILFPQDEDKNRVQRDRASQLRGALEIDTEHPIGNKLLRNKWMHFDERIDKLPPRDLQAVTPQRFIYSREVERYRETTVRLMLMDSLTVLFRDFGEFQLESMFSAVADIRIRTLHAIETWGERTYSDL